MLRLLSLLLLLFFFSGCLATEPKIASWYYTPPHDNATTLYGVGEGFDQNAAKTMALSHISHNLSMTLHSSYVKSDQSVRENKRELTLQEVRHTIKTQAKVLNFSDVVTENEQLINGRVYLLVSISRAALYQEQKEKLSEIINGYKRQFKQMSHLSTLEQFIVLKHFHDDASALKSQTELLHAIDSRQDVRAFKQFVTEHESDYLKRKNSLSLALVSDTQSRGFKEVLEHELTLLGVKITKNGSDGVIKLKSHSKKEYLMGYHFEKCFLHVDMIATNKSVIASSDHVISGKSKVDFSQSHHNCVTKFASKVADEGIFKSLGV